MAQKMLSSNAVTKKARAFLHYLSKDRKLPIQRAYLFGSYARGKPRVDSDIDLCIISPKFHNTYSALVQLWTSRRPEDTGIEPVGFHPRDFQKESPLVAEIRKTGKRITL